MIYAYTTEAYNTLYRTLGFGTASGIGRIGSTIAPYILLPLFYENPSLPWISFTLAAVVSGCASATLPFDTAGKKLDF
jgi:hypothetical protein